MDENARFRLTVTMPLIPEGDSWVDWMGPATAVRSTLDEFRSVVNRLARMGTGHTQ